jgi:hemoglobin
MDLLGTQIFSIIGEAGFRRLTGAFYNRVRTEDILAPLYPGQDFAGAEDRLRGFLIMRFGGPDDYLRRRGHPRLRMRHAPFAIDQRGRDRWIKLMLEAMHEAELPPEVLPPLRRFFEDAATFLINRPRRSRIPDTAAASREGRSRNGRKARRRGDALFEERYISSKE